MSIKVTSNSIPEAAPASKEGSEPKEVTEDKSAPGAIEASEQKDGTESDPVESEASEETEDEAEDEGDEPEAKDSEKDKPKKQSGWQRRINKLNQRASAAQQEAEYWKQQALKGQAAPKDEVKVETPKAADQAGEPKADEFETHAEYVKAVVKWDREQADNAREEKAQKSKLQTEQETLLKSHSERVKAFAEKTKDFQAVIEGVDDVDPSAAIQELILSSENGPELMYELAKNREEFERINKLSPLAAARELGKLEAKFAAPSEDPKKSEPKKQTKAPPPLTPVSSKSVAKEKSIFDADLSQAEYERLRAKQRSG